MNKTIITIPNGIYYLGDYPQLLNILPMSGNYIINKVITGCGATTMMEMLILYKDTVAYLEERGIKVVGNMVGEILTVQEAGGFQMNLAKWDDEIERLWNTPAHTPVFYKE